MLDWSSWFQKRRMLTFLGRVDSGKCSVDSWSPFQVSALQHPAPWGSSPVKFNEGTLLVKEKKAKGRVLQSPLKSIVNVSDSVGRTSDEPRQKKWLEAANPKIKVKRIKSSVVEVAQRKRVKGVECVRCGVVQVQCVFRVRWSHRPLAILQSWRAVQQRRRTWTKFKLRASPQALSWVWPEKGKKGFLWEELQNLCWVNRVMLKVS